MTVRLDAYQYQSTSALDEFVYRDRPKELQGKLFCDVANLIGESHAKNISSFAPTRGFLLSSILR
jgi:hypothetical protein